MKPVQQYHQNMVHAIRDTFDAAALGNGSRELKARLPAGAIVTAAHVHVAAAFDGTAPSLTVGTNPPDYDDIIGAAAVAETTTGGTGIADLALLVPADTAIVARLGGSGTTAGRAEILVQYVADNS